MSQVPPPPPMLSRDSSRSRAPPAPPAPAFGVASSGGLFGGSRAPPPPPAPPARAPRGGAPPPPPPGAPHPTGLFGSVSTSPPVGKRSLRVKRPDDSSLVVTSAMMACTASVADAPPAPPSSGSLFGSANFATMGAFGANRRFSDPTTSTREVPKSKVHALVELQTFEGYWTWGEELFSILGYDMEAMRTKISIMLQNDAKAYLPSDRENDVIATLLVMGWLTREHNDSKDVWELVFEKADTWVKIAFEEMKSELFNDYSTDVWMSLQ
ncbi:hypothetical protein N7528_009298 [Penicillium herquei]|nr:hypothetical protein N7528_009298 [Penicillium herquei]